MVVYQFDDLLGEWRGAGHDGTHRGEVEVVDERVLREEEDDWRHEVQARDAVLLHVP